MSPQQRELFRKAIVNVIEANDTMFGLSEDAIRLFVGRFGFHPAPEELRKELHYLAGKGLIESPAKEVSPENRAYRITAAGMDFMATQERYE